MKRQTRILIAAIVLSATVGLVLMAWFHVIPGGWWLRDRIEAPEKRSQRLRETHRRDRLESFRRETHPGGRPWVFLGSSTIERFDLEHHFPQFSVLNRGVGGESLEDLALRLDVGVPDSITGVVLYGGGIDIRRLGTQPKDAVLRLDRVIQLVRARHGAIPLIVLCPVPGRSLSSTSCGPMYRELIDRLRSHCEITAQTSFVDWEGTELFDARGALREDLAADTWHLNAHGYAIVAERLLANPLFRP